MSDVSAFGVIHKGFGDRHPKTKGRVNSIIVQEAGKGVEYGPNKLDVRYKGKSFPLRRPKYEFEGWVDGEGEKHGRRVLKEGNGAVFVRSVPGRLDREGARTIHRAMRGKKEQTLDWVAKADRPYNPEAPLGYRKPPRRISSTLIGAGVGATAAADELGQGPRMSGKEALALGALGAGIGAAMGGTMFHAGRKVGYKRVQRKYPKS